MGNLFGRNKCVGVNEHKKKNKRIDIIDLKKNPEQFGRFVMALKNLEESDDWYRICGIHGDTFKPDDSAVVCATDPKVVAKLSETGEPFYCKHSVYSFIAWHTPYVYQFELLLNKYNQSGGDYISLPYIDLTNFTNDYSFMNEEFITIEYEGEKKTIENPLAYANYYADGVKTKTTRNGYLTPITRREKIQLNTVKRQLNHVLYAKSYERFSSHPVSKSKTEIVSDYVPLESPHNTLHDVIGGDGGNMSDISISAFDPIFWLHHCNMDRHFYTWLYNNTDHFKGSIYPGKITEETYEATQAPFFKNGIYDTNFKKYGYGWQNPETKFMLLKDMLNVEKFPFDYDIIDPSPDRRTTAFVELISIPIPRETMTVVVYLVPKDQTLNKDTHFAGSASWFGVNRQTVACERCEVTRANVKVDIVDYVEEHGITKENLDTYSLVIEGEGRIVKNEGVFSIYSQADVIKDGSFEIILL